MVWMVTQQLAIRGKRRRVWGGAFLCWVFFMLVTSKISHSPEHHLYADMRNFLGVPNTLNVITNFPFLVVGVLGFVLCFQGGLFNISLPGEVWGWALFYAGIAGLAFGSAYYHLKPEDNRVTWDTLPMKIAYSSLFSSFIVERVGGRTGLSCLFALLFISFLSTAFERTYNDTRLYMMFQLIPCIAIPVMTFVFPPKYTHSRYWLWAAGVYLLSKFESFADGKIYHANHYMISGHSLEHLCSVMVPVLLSIMLMQRNIKCQSGYSKVFSKRGVIGGGNEQFVPLSTSSVLVEHVSASEQLDKSFLAVINYFSELDQDMGLVKHVPPFNELLPPGGCDMVTAIDRRHQSIGKVKRLRGNSLAGIESLVDRL